MSLISVQIPFEFAILFINSLANKLTYVNM